MVSTSDFGSDCRGSNPLTSTNVTEILGCLVPTVRLKAQISPSRGVLKEQRD